MLVAASLDVAVQVYSTLDGMELGGVLIVTVATGPGITVTFFCPATAGSATEVAVMVTVPDKTPVSLSILRMAVPVPLDMAQVNVSMTLLPAMSREAAIYDAVCWPEVIGSEPVTVTVATGPGITVTVLPPDLAGAATEVAVMVAVPDKTPVSLSMFRVAEPVPLELDQLNVSDTVLPAVSRDVAIYDEVSAPEVIGVEPVTATVAMAPGITVTVLPPDLDGAAIDVAVMVAVPDKTPVSLSMFRVAEPVPLELDQLKVSDTVLPEASLDTAV